jgi:hypothetical protein
MTPVVSDLRAFVALRAFVWKCCGDARRALVAKAPLACRGSCGRRSSIRREGREEPRWREVGPRRRLALEAIRYAQDPASRVVAQQKGPATEAAGPMMFVQRNQ